MRNARKLDGRGTLTAITLTLSLAGFGCTTNQNPGSGEPGVTTSPAGTSAPASSSTPGTSSGASVQPTPMVSGAVDPGVDAIAILKANEGYQGKNLGPAAPASGAQMSGGSSSATSQQMVGSPAGVGQGTTVVSGSGEGLAVGNNTGAVLTAQGMTNAATSGIVPSTATGSVTTSSSNAANTAVVAAATPVSGTTTVSAPAAAATRARTSAPAAQVAGGSANQGTRIVTGSDGRQVITNAAPPRSRLRRVTDALRITRSTTTTTTTPAATSTNP